MDRHTPEQRRKNMQAVKNKNSKIEILLRTELWKRGLRYQKNCTDVFGKPDIVFKGKKIAVFCDSEFWHGYNWEERKKDFKSHQEFWIPKIERNMQRDIEVTQKYLKNAYRVLLTRARQGFIIFIPEGDSLDLTRQPEFCDETYRFLLNLGIEEI